MHFSATRINGEIAVDRELAGLIGAQLEDDGSVWFDALGDSIWVEKA
jgi:hypothetical protein